MKMKISMPGIERQLSVSSHLPNELNHLTFAIVITKLPRADPGGRAVCGRSTAGITGSNAAAGMDVLCCLLCG